MSDDDGLCCKEIAIETRAFREANSLRRPPLPFMLHVVTENGSEISSVPTLMRPASLSH